MAKLLVLQGLPGSGKTHWTLNYEEVLPRHVVVCKDDIRTELRTKGWQWSPEAEQRVIAERDRQIIQAATDGCELIISADTNFGKHIGQLKNLATKLGLEFEIKRFDVPLETCLARNAERPEGAGRVPEKAITEMYYRYVAKDPINYPLSAPANVRSDRVVPDDSLMPAIICDLDGTLAINDGHRGPYEFEKLSGDKVNIPVRDVLRVFYVNKQYQIIYCTGREDKFYSSTLDWIMPHVGVPGPLLMRPTGDSRKDSIVKLELFNKHIRGKYDVRFVLDDRNQVVDAWRSIGLSCWQVAPGDF